MSAVPPAATPQDASQPSGSSDANDVVMSSATPLSSAPSQPSSVPSSLPPAPPKPILVPMAPPQPPQNVKVENGFVMDKVDKPFVYGTAAFWLGKNPENTTRYRWTVYVRGLENEDLSYFVKHVTFHLHDDFPEPKRTVYAAPYEVGEIGWGEFMIKIVITFHESSGLDPVEFQHMLKLFPAPNVPPSTKKPVMSEVYDEFVFVNPNKEWFDQLNSGPVRKVENHILAPFFITPEFAKDEDLAIAKLQAANEVIVAQMDQQRARLFLLEQEIDKSCSNMGQA